MEDGLKNEKGRWNLEKIARECEAELRKINIPLGRIVEVIVYRDKYVFGRLAKTWGDGFILYIPNAYRNPKYKLEEIKTAICHQMLHSVRDCMNHGKTWEEYARKADREYGVHIMEQAASRPVPCANWDAGNKKGETKSRGRCCYLDYVERLKGFLEECRDELESIGLHTGNVAEIKFLMDSDYGWCRENNDGTYTILISEKYGRDEADNFGLKGLICHELLHTCPEDDSNAYTGVHGSAWREMARKVERECGYRLMAQSHTDAVRRASGSPMLRHACPNCGGYYDIYDDKDRQAVSGMNRLNCKWCRHKMNIISAADMDVFGLLYPLLGECRDKLRAAGIPIRGISGMGFVSMDSPDGLHDNWDGNYALDLPGIYRQQGNFGSTGLVSYLYKELIRTCEGCWDYGARWEEYVQKAETALGFPIISEGGDMDSL